MDISLFNYSLKLYNIEDELMYINNTIGMLPSSNMIGNRYIDPSINIDYDVSFSWNPPFSADGAVRLYISPDPGLILRDYDTSFDTWFSYNSWNDISINHNKNIGYGVKKLKYTYQISDTSLILTHSRVQSINVLPSALTPAQQTMHNNISLLSNAWFAGHNIDIVRDKVRLTSEVGSYLLIPTLQSEWFLDHSFNGPSLVNIDDFIITGYDSTKLWFGTGSNVYSTDIPETWSFMGDGPAVYLRYNKPYQGNLLLAHRISATSVAVYDAFITVYPWIPNNVWGLYLHDINTTVFTAQGTNRRSSQYDGLYGDFPDTSFTLNTNLSGTLKYRPKSLGNTLYSYSIEGGLQWQLIPPSVFQLTANQDIALEPSYTYYYLHHPDDYQYSLSDTYEISILYNNGTYDFSYGCSIYPEKITNYKDNRLRDIIYDNKEVVTGLASQLLSVGLPRINDGSYYLDLSNSPITGTSINIMTNTDLLAYFTSVRVDIYVSNNMMLFFNEKLLGNTTNDNKNLFLSKTMFQDIRAYGIPYQSDKPSVKIGLKWDNNMIVSSDTSYTINCSPSRSRIRGTPFGEDRYTIPILPDISSNASALFGQIGMGDPYMGRLYNAWYTESALRGNPMFGDDIQQFGVLKNSIVKSAIKLNRWLSNVDNSLYHDNYPSRTYGGNHVPSRYGRVNVELAANATNTRFTAAGLLLYLTDQDPASCKITRYYNPYLGFNVVALFDHSINTRTNLLVKNKLKNVFGGVGEGGPSLDTFYSGIYFHNHKIIYDIRDVSATSYTFNTVLPVINQRYRTPHGYNSTWIISSVPGAVLEGCLPSGVTVDAPDEWNLAITNLDAHETVTMDFPDNYNGHTILKTALTYYHTDVGNIDNWNNITSDASAYINVPQTTIIADYPSRHELSPWIDVATEYGGYTINAFLDTSLINIVDAIQDNYIDICNALVSHITWQDIIRKKLATFTDLLDPKYNIRDKIIDYVKLPPYSQPDYVYQLKDVSYENLSSIDISLITQACQQTTFFYNSSWATIGGTIENPTIEFNLTDENYNIAINRSDSFLASVINRQQVPFTTLCNNIDFNTERNTNTVRPDFDLVYELCIRAMSLKLVDPSYLIRGPMHFPHTDAISQRYISLLYVYAPYYRERHLYMSLPYFSESNFIDDWGFNFIDDCNNKLSEVKYNYWKMNYDITELIIYAFQFNIVSVNQILNNQTLINGGEFFSSPIATQNTEYLYDGYHHSIPLNLSVSPDYNARFPILFVINNLPKNFYITKGKTGATIETALLSLPDTSGKFFVPLDPLIISSLAINLPYDASAGTYPITYECYLKNISDTHLLKSIVLNITIPAKPPYFTTTNYYVNLLNDLPATIYGSTTVPDLINSAHLGEQFTYVASLDETNIDANVILRPAFAKADFASDEDWITSEWRRTYRETPLQPPPTRQTLISNLNRDVIYPLYNQNSMYGYGYNPIGQLTYAMNIPGSELIITPFVDGYVITIGEEVIKISLKTNYLVATDTIIKLRPNNYKKIIEIDPNLMNNDNLILLRSGPGYIYDSPQQTGTQIVSNPTSQYRGGVPTWTYAMKANPNEVITVYTPLYRGSSTDPGSGDHSTEYLYSQSYKASYSASWDSGPKFNAMASFKSEHTLTNETRYLSNVATFKILAESGASALVSFNSKTGLSVTAVAQAMAYSEVSNMSQLDTGFFGLSVTLRAGVKIGIEQKVELIVNWAPNNISLGAGVSSFQGVADYVKASGTVQLGPISATTGGGAKIGMFVSGGGSGSFKHIDGKISLNVSAELGLLLGVSFNLGLKIDINPIIDSVEFIIYGPSYLLISNGMVSASDLVTKGVLEATDAITNGVLSITDVISKGLFPIEKLVLYNFITGYEAVEQGLMGAAYAVSTDLITAEQAIVNFSLSSATLVKYEICTVYYLIEKNIFKVDDFTDNFDLLKDKAEDLLKDHLIIMDDFLKMTLQHYADIVLITTDLVLRGVIDSLYLRQLLGDDISEEVITTINDGVRIALKALEDVLPGLLDEAGKVVDIIADGATDAADKIVGFFEGDNCTVM